MFSLSRGGGGRRLAQAAVVGLWRCAATTISNREWGLESGGGGERRRRRLGAEVEAGAEEATHRRQGGGGGRVESRGDRTLALAQRRRRQPAMRAAVASSWLHLSLTLA